MKKKIVIVVLGLLILCPIGLTLPIMQNIFDTFNKHRKGSHYKEKQPEKQVLVDLFEEIVNLNVFTEKEIELYVNAFIDVEIKARERNSTADAILNVQQRI